MDELAAIKPKRRAPGRSRERRKLSTGQLKERVLDAYVKFGTITAATKAAEVGRATFYAWQKTDPNFAEAVEHARTAVADNLEQEAMRRAYDGSDLLLIFLLKGLKPHRYMERRQMNLDVDSEALRKFFERTAMAPLGPPALTGDIDASLLVE